MTRVSCRSWGGLLHAGVWNTCEWDRVKMPPLRTALTVLVLLVGLTDAAAQAPDAEAALSPDSPAGAALVERLRAGGLVLFFRHADTGGEPCDRSFPLGDPPGHRHISPARRPPAAQIGRPGAAPGP